jgi:hypothetical protein
VAPRRVEQHGECDREAKSGRIDHANTILGLRVNEWTAAIVFAGAVGLLFADAVRKRREPALAEDLSRPDCEPLR